MELNHQRGRIRAAVALGVVALAAAVMLAPAVRGKLAPQRAPVRGEPGAASAPAPPASAPVTLVNPGDRRPGRFASSADSVVVYAVHRFDHTGPTNSYSDYDDTFTPDSIAGWRYVIEVVNGGCTHAWIGVAGQEVIGSNDLSSRVLRAVDVYPTPGQVNDIWITVQATSGSNKFVSVRIVRVKDPTFRQMRDTTHVGPSPGGGYVDTFTQVAGDSMATIRVVNGDPSGFNRVTGATLKLNGVQVLGPSDFNTGFAIIERQAALRKPMGRDTLVLTGEPSGKQLSIRVLTRDITAPVINLNGPPQTDTVFTNQTSLTVSGTVSDEIPGLLSANSGAAQAAPGAFSSTISLPSDATYDDPIVEVNRATLSTTVHRYVVRDVHPPNLTITSPADSLVTALSSVNFAGSWVDERTVTVVTIDGDTVGTARTGSFNNQTVPLDPGPNAILCRATDAAGNVRQFKSIVFRGTSESGASAPMLAALTTTGVTAFLERVSGIYSGAAPVQTGVTASIAPALAAQIHGVVVGRDWGPLPNVKVSVLNHGEYGQALTHTDGSYDLVVNGGVPLTLRFTKADYLESQRLITPAWNDVAVVDSVALVGQSARVNVLDFTRDTTVSGRFASDGNGDRSIRMFFRQGTVMRVVRAPADTVTPNGPYHIRATEYTVGSNGPKTMPAILPPSSAYTYCVSFGIEEADGAVAAGLPSPEILFTKPVICYVPNFLNFPVGVSIPTGAYGRYAGTWAADSDGVVIKVMATGIPSEPIGVDSNGDGLIDGQSRRDTLGIDGVELAQLGRQFRSGEVVWRMPTRHFSTLDYNLNVAVSTAAASVGSGRAQQLTGLLPDHCTATGSIIECENRVLGERIPIVGTPYSLNYRSYRSRGDNAVRSIRIPVMGVGAPPESIRRAFVRMDVAGRRFQQTIETPSSSTPPVTFQWDGLDVFGRWVEGSVSATVAIGYQFDTKYAAGSGGPSLGDPNASAQTLGLATADRSQPNTRWTRRIVSLGAPTTGSDALGGWMISPHHFYDMTGSGALYRGDGSVVLGSLRHPIISAASQNLPSTDITIGPDRNIYVAGNFSIWRTPMAGGGNTLVAGNPNNYFPPIVDGISATSLSCHLGAVRYLDLGPDGTVYFTMTPPSQQPDGPYARVCKVTPDGILHFIAGSGQTDPNQRGTGDGGPALAATFSSHLGGVALGPDGSVFVADANAARVRRIAPSGVITAYAGNGCCPNPSDSTGRATTVGIGNQLGDLATDSAGNLFICGANHVFKVTPDGMISTVLTGSSPGIVTAPSGFTSSGVRVGGDGSLYVTSNGGYLTGLVYRLDPDGTLSQIGGGGAATSMGVFATAANISSQTAGGIDVALDGTVLFGNGNVLSIHTSLPSQISSEFVVPSDDGSEVYFFDPYGRHLRTRDALTGGVRYSFDYDDIGQLIGIHDADGAVTGITRTGNAITIAAPHDIRTTLGLEGGLLKTISDPATQTVTLWPHADGLIDSLQDARGGMHRYLYADDGRLALAIDPALGSQTLNVAYGRNSRTVTRMNGELAVTSYDVVDQYDGTQQRHFTTPGHALRTVYSDSTSGVRTTLFPDGSIHSELLGPSPRSFGMLAPIVIRSVDSLPSSKARASLIATTVSPSDFNPPSAGGTFTEDVKIGNATQTFRTQYTLDVSANTRTINTQSPVGRTAAFTVDTIGRPLTATIQGIANDVAYVYNNQGQLTDINQPPQNGRNWHYEYDAGTGRLSKARDPLGHLTQFGYDDAGRVTTQTLPDSQSVGFGYDGNGNLTSLTTPLAYPHGFSYTGVDQTLLYTPPSLGAGTWSTTYAYNYDRQLKQITRPDNAPVTLLYETNPDTTGRLHRVTIARGSYDYTYVPAGQSSGSGNLQSVTSPDNLTLSFTYDGSLPLRSSWAGIPSGQSHYVEVGYGATTLLPASQNIDGGSSIAFTYDNDELLTGAGLEGLFRGTGGLLDSTALSVSGQKVSSKQDYNGFGELANLHYSWLGSSYLESMTRDGLGRIATMSEAVSGDSARSYFYTYTTAGRLRAVRRLFGVDTLVIGQYGYDANGNRTASTDPSGLPNAVTASYDAQDRLTAYGNATYSYSRNGELSKRAFPLDTTLYTYDELGNLLTVVKQGGTTLTYLIDGENRRVGKKRNGTLERVWLYQNGLNVVAELDGSGSLKSRFVYGSRSNVPDYMVTVDSTYRLITDQLGSVRRVVNVVSGSTRQRLEYDAWGNVLTDTAPGFQPFGFAGGLYDPDTKLVRFEARDYDASVGRWTAKDPVGFDGGDPNLYAYALSSPNEFIDPFGLEFISPKDARKIPDKARGWAGTPYVLGGKQNQIGADCSGAVWGIYQEAGLKYDYSPTSQFPRNPHFKPIPDQSAPQPGDVGWWNGHMVIYDPNAGPTKADGKADSWSAHHPGGAPFGPAKVEWFANERGRVTWYRYWNEGCGCAGQGK